MTSLKEDSRSITTQNLDGASTDSNPGDTVYSYDPNAAGDPHFTERTGIANPLDGIDAGYYNWPTFADLDDDGDLDLVVNASYYYENTGTGNQPDFTERTGDDNPLDDVRWSSSGPPSFADLDNDGDLDLVVGEDDGALYYYENTGSRSQPGFTARTGTANPLAGIDGGDDSTPTFADLDDDGDLDLVVGEVDGALHYYENTGSRSQPDFTGHAGAANPLEGIYLGYPNEGAARYYHNSTPTFTDLDDDGDLDLVVGDNHGTLHYYENTGTRSQPSFIERNGAANPLDGLDVDDGIVFVWQVPNDNSAPTFADLDGDGDPDLVVGEHDGTLHYYENTGTRSYLNFIADDFANPMGGVDVGYFSAPTLADLDGDGDLDLVVGEYGGYLLNYFENTGSRSQPTFTERPVTANPLADVAMDFYGVPNFVDLDDDGDLDLVVTERDGTLNYFENTGTPSQPDFTERTGVDSHFNGIEPHRSKFPVFADLDGDGDPDLLFSAGKGYSAEATYYENTGTPSQPNFISRGDSWDANIGSLWLLDEDFFAFADLDGDGDLDIAALSNRYYENIGTHSQPDFRDLNSKSDYPNNPLYLLSMNDDEPLIFGDLDDDGDLDLVRGNNDGTIHYFENTGTPNQATFVKRIGGSHPFDGPPLAGVEIGLLYIENLEGNPDEKYKPNPTSPNKSKPAFADLDGDGDLDLVVGLNLGAGGDYGALYYYENTGTPSQPDFIRRVGGDNPLVDIGVRDSGNAPAFADLDDDGDLDLVMGEGFSSRLHYYKNIGTPSQPNFAETTGTGNPLGGVEAYWLSTPTFADLDSDGDLDLVVGEGHGRLFYYENTGSRSQPVFTERGGGANPLSDIELYEGASAPAFADLDNDGDLDLVVGEWYGYLNYFENIGSRSQPDFAGHMHGSAVNPLEGIDVGHYSAPTFADLDNDGDLDLVVGENGHLYHFENTGSRTDASFTPLRLSQSVALTLHDTGGSDTLDLRTDTADQRVDLRPEGISDVYGLVGSLVIARGTVIEHFIAGSGNDTIIGNAAANHLQGRSGNDSLWGSSGDDVLEGGAGADRLEGGAGVDQLSGGADVDTVSYQGSDAGVTVKLREGIGERGHAEGDVIAGVENVIGSDYRDVLGGDSGANHLVGGAGNDGLWGSGGDDVLEGGAGADRLEGDAGMDTVSYQGSDAGVAVKLREGTGKRGHAEGDVIAEVENVIGSDYNDTLVGDSLDNLLTGNAGNDLLWGSAGNDILIGGPGADRLVGSSGHDTASYTHSPTGVTVRLHSLSATGGDATGDTFPYRVDVAWTDSNGVEQTESLPDVEHLSGSAHDDVLAGDRRDNVIDGGAGHDTLYGGPGGGDDRLDGGPGDDRLYGGQGSDRLAGAAGDDRLVGGPGADVFVVAPGEGQDTVTDFTDGEDRIDLTAFGLAGIDDLTVATTTDGVALDLTDSGGGTILLADFAMANLDATDFIV